MGAKAYALVVPPLLSAFAWSFAFAPLVRLKPGDHEVINAIAA